MNRLDQYLAAEDALDHAREALAQLEAQGAAPDMLARQREWVTHLYQRAVAALDAYEQSND